MSRGTTNADNIQVSGYINDVCFPLIVDSGSNCTLLRRDVLCGAQLPEITEGLCDVTGRRSTLRGPTEVQIRVGGHSSAQKVYVADELAEPCILGLDYLVANQGVIDMSTRQLKLNGLMVPLTMGSPNDCTQATAFRVRVRDAVTLEPGTEAIVPCEAVGKVFDSPGVVEAGSVLPFGVMVGRTMVKANGSSFRVLMANLSEDAVKMEAGLDIGACEPAEVMNSTNTNPGVEDREHTDHLPYHMRDLMERAGAKLSDKEKEQVRGLLLEYSDVFSSSDSDLGRTSLAEHHIDTGDHRPVKLPLRRIPVSKREEADKMVQEMIQQGLIEESKSPWSSALVLVKKKDGSLRCCVDYRALNDVTVKDSYPIPRIDDTLDALSGAHWFSTLDLKSGYHQIGMAEEDKPKTAFSCGSGLWQWRVMPFGLCNAPATFERLMEVVLSGLHWKTLLVYLDDVIVFAGTFAEELQRLREVFLRMRSANLKLNPKKCQLFQDEVKYLGHVVSRQGVSTDPGKTSAIVEWTAPKNRSELRSFLGLCSYYRKFVQNFATIAQPLHALTKEGVKFAWNSECGIAFEQLKRAITTSPVLRYPDPKKGFTLDTDASNCGIGAVLSQLDNGQEQVVAYYSRALSSPEKNYCATRKELLAIVDAVRHFHHYLYGARFTVRTDHSALQWLKTLKDPEGQLARWLGRLGQYDYKVQHRPGVKHTNADSLSRRPCDTACKHCQRKEEDSDVCCRSAQTSNPADDGADLDLTDIKVEQRQDTDLAPIIRHLAQGTKQPEWVEVTSTSAVTKRYWAQWDMLQLSDGVLRRRWESVDGKTTRWLVVVPMTMRKLVLQETHGSLTSGHFGTKKTLQRLRTRFYWIGMRQDVKEWCRVCEVCVAKKGPSHVLRAPLQIHNVGAPMERIAVDITGPLPVSTSGNRYIVVAMDYFTKWPEAYPVPNQEAATVARVLVDDFFCRFGVPYELHSDQGRNFESKVFQECCKLLGIRKTRTTPLHPESDGMVERFNRTLGQELAKRCRHGQEDWDLHLPTILMSYRSAVHESTGYTPAHLMTGRDLRLPVDLMMQRPPGEEVKTETLPHFIRNLHDRLREAHEATRDQLRVTSQSMKLRQDARASMKPLAPGDKVWLYNPRRKKGQSPKLMSAWEGPFEVVQKLSSVVYRIRKRRNAALKVVHYNRLWKIDGDPKFSWSGTRDSEMPEDGTADVVNPQPAVQARERASSRRHASDRADENRLNEDRNPPQQNSQLPKGAQTRSQSHDSGSSNQRSRNIADQNEALNRRELRRDRRPPVRFGNFVCQIGSV